MACTKRMCAINVSTVHQSEQPSCLHELFRNSAIGNCYCPFASLSKLVEVCARNSEQKFPSMVTVDCMTEKVGSSFRHTWNK